MTPLALFVYARPDHTRATLEALLANRRTREIALTVFCDGPRDAAAAPRVAATRAVVHALLDGCDAFGAVEFVERDENRGLAPSVIAGVDALLDRSDRVIVVEDDLVTAPGFLAFLLDGLEAYRDQPRIATVGGYTPGAVTAAIPADYPHDVYFNPRNSSWGWATWRDRWRDIDFSLADYPAFKSDLDLQIGFCRCGDDVTAMLYHAAERGLSSWAIRASYGFFRKGRLSVLPCRSLVANIGLDGSGEHCVANPALAVDLSQARESHRFPAEIAVDERIMDVFRAHFRRPHPGLIGGGADTYWMARRTPADLQRLARATEWIALGAAEKARTLLEVHLLAVPDDPEALTLLGIIALSVDAHDAAAQMFRRALSSKADHAAAIAGLQRAVNLSSANPG